MEAAQQDQQSMYSMYYTLTLALTLHVQEQQSGVLERLRAIEAQRTSGPNP